MGRWGEDTKNTPCECWGLPHWPDPELLVFTQVDACHWRRSAAICVAEGHLTAKTKRTVMNMSNKYLLRVLGSLPRASLKLPIFTGVAACH